MVRARDDGVVEHPLSDRPASMEAHVRDGVESSFHVEQGDGMALDHDDPPFPRLNVGGLRDPNERRHRDYRAANAPMNVCEVLWMAGGMGGPVFP